MRITTETIKREDLKAFVHLCAKHTAIDPQRFFSLAEQALAYYKGNLKERVIFRSYQDIENRWYASLASGSPDYSVYSDPYMLAEVWACWVLYSRGYIKLIDKPDQTEFGSLRDALGHVGSICDLGCGCGYTTAALKATFQLASVTGTQVPGSPQFEIASRIGSDSGFRVVAKIQGQADLIFASEYFEHFEAPVEHLREVLAIGKPRAMIIANAFGAKSVGHFDTYKDKGQDFTPSAISREFNSCLRAYGLRPVKTKFWNNRPRIWRK
jgi:hypothetical protein